MRYSLNYDRSLMIILLMAYIIRVGSAAPLGKREFPATEPGPPPPTFQLLEAARWTAASLARTSDKVLWNVGKLLLSAGESVNYVWDVALHASVRLLKAGGSACGSIADRLAHVPVIGFGASGVRQAVGVAVDAVASNVAHDTLVRRRALAALNARLNESDARLQAVTGGPTPAAAPPESDGRCRPDDTLPTAAATDTTDATATEATANAVATTTNEPSKPTADQKNSSFSTCKNQLCKSISNIGRSTGIALKAFGEAAMAVMGFIFGSYNTISSTTAATGEKVAAGINTVNDATGRLLFLHDMTAGVATLATGLADTFRKNSVHNNKRRIELYNKLNNDLDNFHPESRTFLMTSTTDDKGGDQTTVVTAGVTTVDTATPTPPIEP